jgi:hypothetical protein
MRNSHHSLLSYFAFFFVLGLSQADQSIISHLQPQPLESFNLSLVQVINMFPTNWFFLYSQLLGIISISFLEYEKLKFLFFVCLKNAGSCYYTVLISTSCSSPRYTRDQIGISFGDAYGNQVWSWTDFMRWRFFFFFCRIQDKPFIVD